MDRNEKAFPQGFAGHRRQQAIMGLRLSPAQRLRWLEETMETMRRWCGRARASGAAKTCDGAAKLLDQS